jgi:DNA-binding MarR family transcriptional regulator
LVDVNVDPADLAQRVRPAVTRLARLLRQQGDGSLSPTLSATLWTISREGPLTLGELAAHEQVAAPTITKAVSRLEADGLVTRRADPSDGRVCRVTISAAGRRRLDASRSRKTAWLTTRLAGLPDEDLERLAAAVDVLERLTMATSGQDVT